MVLWYDIIKNVVNKSICEVKMEFTDTQQKEIISNNLTYYIEQSGKEQKQIAIDLGVQTTTLNTWVKGRALPPISQIQRIAAYFHLLVTDIVNPRTEIPDDRKLMRYYYSMNEAGQKELVKYARLLFKSGDYSQIDWRKKDGESD